MITAVLQDSATSNQAAITKNGELIVAPLSNNQSAHWKIDTINTAYNYAVPMTGKKMLLQNILVYANKNVGVNDATITVYTSTAINSLTAVSTVLEIELPKYASRDITGLNLELPEGVFLNAKTDDNDVYLTMMGYYFDA